MEFKIGTVKSWFDGKGFGFIVQEGDPGDVFVHHSSILMEGRRCLNPGQQVRFRLERRDRGLAAVDVEVLKGVPGRVRCHACGQEVWS